MNTGYTIVTAVGVHKLLLRLINKRVVQSMSRNLKQSMDHYSKSVFVALSVDPRVGISWSASKTDD